MRQTVVGVFDRQETARVALETLAREHFDPARVHATDDRSPLPESPDAAVHHPVDDGVMANVRHFFAEILGLEHDVTPYANIVRSGGAVVRVDVDDQPQAVRAELALVKAGAVDITRRTNA